MKKTQLIIAAPALLLCAATAHAEISANVALTTDYVWRGVSQSDDDAAIQGGFDYSHDSGLYAGIWGSNVDFDGTDADDADLEIDYYGGYATEISGVGVDVGVIYYDYPGAEADLDWAELYLAASYEMFSASINYSDDVFSTDESGIYYTLGYDQDIGTTGFSVSAGLGYYDADEDVFDGDKDSYLDWNLGVSTELEGVGLDLTYYDTDSDGETIYGSIADARLVFTVSKSM